MSIKTLARYALDHYEQGGHWIYECYSDDDYRKVLDESNNDIDRATARLKYLWELTNEQEAETRWE